MGLFDYVDYEGPCPKCGATLKGFQSKDGPCEMGTVAFSSVSEFYTHCHNCSSLVEYRLKLPEHRPLDAYAVTVTPAPYLERAVPPPSAAPPE